jgi:hypothetical protein
MPKTYTATMEITVGDRQPQGIDAVEIQLNKALDSNTAEPDCAVTVDSRPAIENWPERRGGPSSPPATRDSP